MEFASNIFTNGRGVAWNGTLWVAVGQGTNSIAYSDNGLDWIPVNGSNNIFENGLGVAWNGKRWVAVGSVNASIVYSANGIDWFAVTNSETLLSPIFRGVAGNPTIGPVKINSQLVLNKYKGINPSQTIVINTGTYYDKSIGELVLTIKGVP